MSSIPSIPIPITDIPTKLAMTLGALFVRATIAAVYVTYLWDLPFMLKSHLSCDGITILQTVVYYKLNPNDPWIFRYSVRNPTPSHLISIHLSYTHTGRLIIVCCHQAGYIYNLSSCAMICRILDMLHIALSIHGLYFYLIESFGNYLALLSKVIWYSYPIYGVP